MILHFISNQLIISLCTCGTEVDFAKASCSALPNSIQSFFLVDSVC